jgi:23S rRNA pseudouridine1911/1915/1917 synthase
MSRRLELILEAEGQRVDKALAAAHPDISRSQWQQLINEGLVTIGGEPVKASLRLEGGERVQVLLPETRDTGLVAQQIPLDIVYEDGDFLAVNKEAGMVVHPAPGHSEGTLVNAVLGHCPDIEGIGGERRPGIVHRLDKETSGLILIAKNDHALRHLQRQFKKRTVQKRYLALVEGHIQPPRALIDAPIGRDPKHRQQMAVIPPGSSASSRPAQTEYHILATYNDFSLVECFPRTGRTHQIRVHLAFAGYPIVGDTLYGRRKQRVELDRHFLHAASLTFRRPADDEEMTLEARLPQQLQTVLQELKGA